MYDLVNYFLNLKWKIITYYIKDFEIV
jgi:hypothetical protein